jgi:hypothetical protein
MEYIGGSDSFRYFKIIYINNKKVKDDGRYKTKGYPGDAAKKAFTQLSKKYKINKLIFCIKETTQGSTKKEHGPYLGEKIKLKKPLTVKYKGKNGKNKPVIKYETKIHFVKEYKQKGGEKMLNLIEKYNVNKTNDKVMKYLINKYLNKSPYINKIISNKNKPKQQMKLIKIVNELKNKNIWNILKQQKFLGCGAVVIAQNEMNGYELILKKLSRLHYRKKKVVYDSFGGYGVNPSNLPYLMNALRLELFDEGNILITPDNLISISPLIFITNTKKENQQYISPVQIIVLKKELLTNKLFSWEDSKCHPYKIDPDFVINNTLPSTTCNGLNNKITEAIKKGKIIEYKKLTRNNNKYDVELGDTIIRDVAKQSFDLLNSEGLIHKTIIQGHKDNNFINLTIYQEQKEFIKHFIESPELDKLKLYMRESWLPLLRKVKTKNGQIYEQLTDLKKIFDIEDNGE